MKMSRLPDRWWEQCSCMSRVFSKRDHIKLTETIAALSDYQAQGIGAIEIFAPYHGGLEYGALDPYNFYVVDPEIGTMHDFIALVDACHDRGMAVVIFINVGYAAMEDGAFLKAQDDVRRGIDSREARMFIWDETGKAPAVECLSNSFGRDPEGEWVFSERAGKYYWVRWRGFGEDVALPQYNFASNEWQAECQKVLRFWLDTGIDGMLIDAPFCYANCDMATHNRCITDVIREYPNQYIQPEGGGGAPEELLKWVNEAGYNSLQDYAIYTHQKGKTGITELFETLNTARLETLQQGWRDVLVEAGATTYLGSVWRQELSPAQRLVELVTIVTIGSIYHDDNKLMYVDLPTEIRHRLSAVFMLCDTLPALRLNGKRRALWTRDGVYAFLRHDGRGHEAIVAINYADEPRDIELDLPKEARLSDAFSGEEMAADGKLVLRIPGCDHRIIKVD